MINCLFVGAGGFIGSVLRYLLGMVPIKNNDVFPINTLLINIAGAFLIGIVISVFAKNSSFDERWLLLLKVGVCGGFTTFSTFSNEALELIKSGNAGLALLYAALSVCLCVAAVLFGQLLVK